MHLIRAVWKMAKVQRKQRTCKLRGNMSFAFTTTVTAVHKCIYPGSQWSSLVWDPEQVIIVLFTAVAILIRYRRRWSMSWARRTRRRSRQDQLVFVKVETWRRIDLYRPSEPTSTISVRTSFVPRDFWYSLILCLRLLQISSITDMSYMNTSITSVW